MSEVPLSGGRDESKRKMTLEFDLRKGLSLIVVGTGVPRSHETAIPSRTPIWP